MQTKIKEWLSGNTNDRYYKEMQDFSTDFDRKNAHVKNLRNIFMTVVGSNKDWEIPIAQAIANLNADFSGVEGSLRNFLGEKLFSELIIKQKSTLV